jgi:hypothetical protein
VAHFNHNRHIWSLTSGDSIQVSVVFLDLSKSTGPPRNNTRSMIFILNYAHKAHTSMLALLGLPGLQSTGHSGGFMYNTPYERIDLIALKV